VHNDSGSANLVVQLSEDAVLVGILALGDRALQRPLADLAWFFHAPRGALTDGLQLLDECRSLRRRLRRGAGWRPEPQADLWAVQSLTKTAIGCLLAIAILRPRGYAMRVRYANMGRSGTTAGLAAQMLRDGEWGSCVTILRTGSAQVQHTFGARGERVCPAMAPRNALDDCSASRDDGHPWTSGWAGRRVMRDGGAQRTLAAAVAPPADGPTM
jgi:hypothetical protein